MWVTIGDAVKSHFTLIGLQVSLFLLLILDFYLVLSSLSSMMCLFNIFSSIHSCLFYVASSKAKFIFPLQVPMHCTLCILRMLKGSRCLSFCLFVAGKDCRPRMCITTAAQTTGGTMWCLLPSASTARTTFISSLTATPTPTRVCSITWPAWSAEISITWGVSSWASAWLVAACVARAFASVCRVSFLYCVTDFPYLLCIAHSITLRSWTHVSVSMHDVCMCACACICTGTRSFTVPTGPSLLLSNNCWGKTH